MINLCSIENAKKRLNGIIHKTPMTFSPILSELSGLSIYLKEENLQYTGTFKIRGAFNN